GCSLHQTTVVSPPEDLPQSYLRSSADQNGDEATQLAPQRWWTAFEDQQLNTLMQQMLQNNLALGQAYARLQQVEASSRIVRSAQRPTLSGEADIGRSHQPGIVDDFTGNNQQLSLAAGFELDLWGKLAARSRAAQSSLMAAEDEVQTLYLGLSARLADLYFLAMEQRAQLSLNDRSIASFEDTLIRVEDRYLFGLVPAVDLYQARQSLAATKAARYLFESGLAETEHAISILLGHYPKQQISGVQAILPKAPVLFATGVPSQLLTQRPDLRAELQRIDAADAGVAAAIADRFPSIRLQGSYGSLRQDVMTGLLTGEFWSLLGSLTLPIVDGGRREAEVDRNRAVLEESVLRYEQAVLQAFGEVEDALVNNQSTEQRIARLAETSKATGATLRLSTERYLFGITDYLPVLTAQRSDFEAQSRLLSAQRQLLSDRISLARALGGNWMGAEMELRLSQAKDVTR
ncbi:MAG: efflux transporter outer membrane subunit, partial [Desulfuromonadales bacterium]|nr:efflux transporter outer membrane subunit [Desulfuromonadales bacterium]